MTAEEHRRLLQEEAVRLEVALEEEGVPSLQQARASLAQVLLGALADPLAVQSGSWDWERELRPMLLSLIALGDREAEGLREADRRFLSSG